MEDIRAEELQQAANAWNYGTVGGADGWVSTEWWKMQSELWNEMAKVLNKIESQNRWPTSADVVPNACLSKLGEQVAEPEEVPIIFIIWSTVRRRADGEMVEEADTGVGTGIQSEVRGYNKHYDQCCWNWKRPTRMANTLPPRCWVQQSFPAL